MWKEVVLQISQDFLFLKALYLLKDICKLAQNVFLQALERGDAAGERQNREIQYMKDPEMFSVLNLKKKEATFPEITFFVFNLTECNQSCDVSCS